jgi:hypothetical protein
MMAHFSAACRYVEPVETGTVTDVSNSLSSAGQDYTNCSAITGTTFLPIGQPVTSARVGRAQVILGPGGATDAK